MKKWWGIRHVRWYFKVVSFNKWWFKVGRYLGAVPNPSDIEHLERVWRGEE